MQALYDRIGRQYRGTRAADPRITDRIVELLALPAGATLCDVGAGAGNYTNALAERGYRMLAVEPSETMRRQAPPHARVTWSEGVAEALPLPDECADGMVCTLAAHHFKDLPQAAREMRRVCPLGPWLFLTHDPRAGEAPWFAEYFPEIRERDFPLFPPLEAFAATVGAETGRAGEIHDFPLPADLIDNVMYAPWNRPETYLDPAFRANTSGFALTDPVIVERRVETLRVDLASGAWDARHGALRTRDSYDAGYRFVTFRTRPA
jgi:ubiquinone/menaquinone biosynthesis C-methylase UbiE